jgi:hypothetical protein
MVTPSEQEMVGILRALYGPDWFRQPKRTWEELWKTRRGELNHILGMRQFQGPKRQRGSVGITVMPYGAQGEVPILSDIVNATSSTAPTPSRQSYAFDSDGAIVGDTDATIISSIVYTKITTQTDDANDHTSEWWPSQPDTNEGLNWDIRYLNAVGSLISGSGAIILHLFEDGGGVDRTTDVWYLLDTVSNDHADAGDNGAIGCNRTNGGGKSPTTGLSNLAVDVEIRATGSGSAVASMSFDLDVQGT